MSRDSEKLFKDLEQYLELNTEDNMSEDEMNELIQQFMDRYNDNISFGLTEETAKTSDDYLELAENANDRMQAIKYAKKAVELDSDNIDARVMVEELTTEHPYDMLGKYHGLIEQAKEILKKNGYMNDENIGEFWRITATRPFMRLYSNYLELLVECGMMRMAANAAEEMLQYNENDNLGIRYNLMHIYCYLEDEEKMMELYHKYDEHDESQMLMPISILYYKKNEFAKAEEYLRRLMKLNKDTGRFIRAVLNDKLDKYASRMNPMGYQPFTIEELMVELYENDYLFKTTACYFDWAAQVIKKVK